MPTRNTAVLERIVKALGESAPHTLARLEDEFKDSLLVVAGDVNTVARDAEKLRLRCSSFLDQEPTESKIHEHSPPQAIHHRVQGAGR